MNKTRPLAAMVFAIVLFASSHRSVAQTIAPAFISDYSFISLGSAPGVPPNYGGLTLLAGNTNTLLLGGGANGANGAIYSIGVTRDAGGHITGFSGSASLFATAPNIDGGLAYGPGGVLFYTGYSNNILGQIKPGSTSPDKITDLTPLGVTSSVGTVQFIPAGFANAGAIRIASYSGGGIYSSGLSADGTGTFDLSTATLEASTGGVGPEGLIYVPLGSPLFTAPSMLISEFGLSRVSAYDLDSNGNPVPATRRDFMTGLNGTEGAFTDPLTGDFLFSTYGGANQVIAVRGFAGVPEPSSAILLALGGLGLAHFFLRKKRAVSRSNAS